MPPSPDDTTLDSVRKALDADGRFETERGDAKLVARRRRNVPRRGLFRLLIPQAKVVVTRRATGLRTALRPDAVAVFMLVTIIGGVVVELTTDRVKYPRRYPPEFVFVLGGLYLFFFVLECVRTRRAVAQVVERARILNALD